MNKKYQSDQRGIAHLMYAVIVVVVIAIIAVVGWQVAGKNKNGSTTSSTSSSSSASAKAVANAAQSACMTKLNDKDFCKFTAQEAAQPFEKTASVITMTGTSSGESSTITLKQDGKGNTQLSMDTGGTTFNSIELNGHTYAQTAAGGPWIDYGSSTAPGQTNPDSSLTSLLSDLVTTKITRIGSEACGNLTCLKYQVSDSTTPTGTQYIWFDTSSYMMREYSETGVTASGDSMDMKINYQAVTISMPSPVQSLSAATGQ